MVTIRSACIDDFDAVIKIDAEVSLDWHGIAINKPDYWQDIFNYYLQPGKENRLFLVAEEDNAISGFIIGEARVWEFGSPLCGWVFAVEISASKRNLGVGQMLFKEICARLKKCGALTVRTMVDMDNKKTVSFFRSQGMRAGKHVELEMPI